MEQFNFWQSQSRDQKTSENLPNQVSSFNSCQFEINPNLSFNFQNNFLMIPEETTTTMFDDVSTNQSDISSNSDDISMASNDTSKNPNDPYFLKHCFVCQAVAKEV